MTFFQDFFLVIARICIASLFLWAGLAKLKNWKGTIAYMQSKNFPLIPLMLPAAVLIQVAGSLSVLLGFYARFGALILMVFTILAAVKMHNFWTVSGDERVNEQTFFMKDVAIVGGLIFLFVFGPGSFIIK